MKKNEPASPRVVLAAFLLLAASSFAIAASSSKPPAPRFPQREGRPRAAAPARATRPTAHAPAELVPARAKSNRRAAVEREASDAEIESRGVEAGAAMADALAASEGRLVAYRVGVWEGQNAALADPLPDRFEYEAGLRRGRWDPEARAYGTTLGAADAGARAGTDAAHQVELQFRDLDRKPVQSPRIAPSEYLPELPTTPTPDIAGLYAEFPPARVPGVAHALPAAFAGWSYDPARLHGCKGWREFSSFDWQDPDAAFHRFKEDPRRSAYYRRLPSPRARALFEASFLDGFLDRLPATYDHFLDPAFADGYDDGWGYGAFLHAEWSFRRGYAEGFDDAAVLAAQVSFERAYPIEYGRVYDATFREWMDSARPAILGARLLEDNDDGIFEPGEALVLELELANYGGAAGTFPLSLEGKALAAPVDIDVPLPARRRLMPRELATALEETTRAPSTQTLVLRVGPERQDLPLLVSYPMEFTGNISYQAAALDGRGRVRFEVVNRSRRTVEAVDVARETVNGAAAAERKSLGAVAPGVTTEAEFVVEGIRALDFIAGDVEVVAALEAGGKTHGRKTARFPELATRLDDPTLVEYLVRLGSDADPDLRDVRQARRLLMQRLEADWRARCEEDGNSYQADVANGSARTALGELVAAYGRERKTLSRSIAFHGLDDEIRALAEGLPGVHPNLRRSMKKLAARIES